MNRCRPHNGGIPASVPRGDVPRSLADESAVHDVAALSVNRLKEFATATGPKFATMDVRAIKPHRETLSEQGAVPGGGLPGKMVVVVQH